jgi:DNA-binding MarR family transcriptional regulator
MNLIELFESKPFQDVGTFNSIFKATPILGFSSSTEVEILGMTPKGRRILVGGQELTIDLIVDGKQKKVKAKRIHKEREVKAPIKPLSKLFSDLTPSEFMLYSAIKEAGEVNGLTKLLPMLNMNYKTSIKALKKLVEKKLVVCENKSKNFNRISLTQEIK